MPGPGIGYRVSGFAREGEANFGFPTWEPEKKDVTDKMKNAEVEEGNEWESGTCTCMKKVRRRNNGEHSPDSQPETRNPGPETRLRV